MKTRIRANAIALILVTFLVSFFMACVPGNQERSGDSIKFQQYYAEGERLYKAYCSNCHQNDGTGLRRLYPPLVNSDFMTQNLNEVLCIIKYGRKGELWVNRIMYNQPMKGNPGLTELEVAEIATYIYNSWGNVHETIEVAEVASVLASCEDKE